MLKKIAALITVIGIVGCSPSDPQVSDCAAIESAYLGAPLAQSKYAELSLETQYKVLICGSQRHHPPILFTGEFATRGLPAARFLAQRLSETEFDPTVRDILSVYAEMQFQGSYDVRSDPEIMALLVRKVSALKSPDARNHAEQVLESIRTGTPLRPH